MFLYFLIHQVKIFIEVHKQFLLKYNLKIDILKLNIKEKGISLNIFNFNLFVGINLNNLCFYVARLSLSFSQSLKIISRFDFNLKFLCMKIFKAYGINMRILRLYKRKKRNILFLRLGYSHGFFIQLLRGYFFRVFKRRYFLIVGNDLDYLNNLNYHLRWLRRFFRYKLIGIKTLRDRFKVKIGKKKNF